MRHRDGILAWFDSRIANGLIEGINSLVQAAKAKARGYRSTRKLKAITPDCRKARPQTTRVKCLPPVNAALPRRVHSSSLPRS
jgi:Transposase